MFTSITTRSGRRARTFSRASRPFSPSPTTVMSNWALISVASALRNRGWSSTSSTRSFGGRCATRVLCVEPDDDRRPLVRGSMHIDAATDLLDPLAHGRQAEAALHGARDGRRVEAYAIVLDRERGAAVPGSRSARSPACARECLRVLVSASWTTRRSWTSDRGLSARRVSPSQVSVATMPGLAAVLAQVLAQRALEAVVLADGLAQAEDRLADVAVGLVRGLGEGGQLVGDAEARLVLGPRLERPELQVDHAQDLGQAVVELAGDPVALGVDRPLLLGLVEAGGADGDRRPCPRGRRGGCAPGR